jgi:hypothetical protein
LLLANGKNPDSRRFFCGMKEQHGYALNPDMPENWQYAQGANPNEPFIDGCPGSGYLGPYALEQNKNSLSQNLFSVPATHINIFYSSESTDGIYYGE